MAHAALLNTSSHKTVSIAAVLQGRMRHPDYINDAGMPQNHLLFFDGRAAAAHLADYDTAVERGKALLVRSITDKSLRRSTMAAIDSSRHSGMYRGWMHLRNRFRETASLRVDIHNEVMQNQTKHSDVDDLLALLTKLDESRRQLRSCGTSITAAYFWKCMQTQFPDDLANHIVVYHHEAVSNKTSLDAQLLQFRAILIQRQCSLETQSSRAQALRVETRTCFGCNKEGHIKADCPDLRSSRDKRPRDGYRHRHQPSDASRPPCPAFPAKNASAKRWKKFRARCVLAHQAEATARAARAQDQADSSSSSSDDDDDAVARATFADDTSFQGPSNDEENFDY